MPQQIRCEKCGIVLYEGAEVKDPFEIAKLFDGKCPRCRKILSSVPINVEIKSVHLKDCVHERNES